jgi:hypothetical protein
MLWETRITHTLCRALHPQGYAIGLLILLLNMLYLAGLVLCILRSEKHTLKRHVSALSRQYASWRTLDSLKRGLTSVRQLETPASACPSLPHIFHWRASDMWGRVHV